MQYVSTRGGSDGKNFMEILLEGLAEDGGLYMPKEYPQLEKLESYRGLNYVEVALYVLRLFAPDIPLQDLYDLLVKTYTKEAFGSDEITPVKLLEKNLALLKLSEGPTLAFKDVPLQLLGNLMEYALRKNKQTLNILGATSGDTGSAAEYALLGKRGVRVFMLSPAGRMSAFQQKQMYAINDPNIFNLVVDGNFDDCQAIVKAVNADADFKKRFKIGAVNSINWARIAAQVVYYVFAYLRATTHEGQRIVFSIPSGNFGNALSAFIAKRMGLPVDLLVACNENDVLDEFFRTDGIYRVRKGSEVKITSSPSMDIASASNFERYIWDLCGRHSKAVSALYKQLEADGMFDVRPMLPGETTGVISGRANDRDVLKTIKFVFEDYKIIIDPHTAVAMKVGMENASIEDMLVVAETAQPAKFADTIYEAIGVRPRVPKAFQKLLTAPEFTKPIDNDAEKVKEFISYMCKPMTL